MHDLMTRKRTTFGSKPKVAKGDNELAGSIVDSYHTTHPLRCQPPFDANLSRRLDAAVIDADAAHLGACDAWALCRHAAGESLRLADERDRCLAEVIRLESLMPEGEDKR